MFSLLVSVFTALCSSFRTRAALQLEILALRHQINVLRRSQRGRVHLVTADRLFWTWLMYLWSGCPSALAKNDPCLLAKSDRDRKHIYARRSQSLPFAVSATYRALFTPWMSV